MAGLRVLAIWMLPRSTSPPPEKPVSGCQVLPSASTKGILAPASMRMVLADDLDLAGVVEAVIFVGRVVGEVESDVSVLCAQPQRAQMARPRHTLICFITSFRSLRLVRGI